MPATQKIIKNKARPLSPHILIYRPQLTSMLSILHRICGGVVIVFGFPIFLWWLSALTVGAQYYEFFQSVMSHWIMRVYTAGIMFCAYYHLMNGLRHLIWDTGHGLDLKSAQGMGIIGFITALILTASTLFFIYQEEVYALIQ